MPDRRHAAAILSVRLQPVARATVESGILSA
jgi:hypothetical protein